MHNEKKKVFNAMKRKRSFHLPWKMLPVIFALAWPTMLEQLMQTAVQYIDTAMVGSLGTQATAAVGATSFLIQFITNFFIGLFNCSYFSTTCRTE